MRCDCVEQGFPRDKPAGFPAGFRFGYNVPTMKRFPLRAALQKTFVQPTDYAVALGVSAAVFALFVLVPVWTTPGNDVAFQLHLLSWPVLTLMVALSLLNGVLVHMQLWLRKRRLADSAGKQAAGAVGILVSSIAATMACAACYSSLLALFGLGGTIFVATYRWWFAAFALSLTLFALYHTSRRVLGLCDACKIPAK